MNNTIKTSPFAAYQNEELIRYIPECPRSIFLSDLDKTILIILNKYRILTSSLCVAALTKLGLENFTQSDIQNRLRILSEAAFAVKGEFKTQNAKSAHKVFMLGFRGRGWLKANGIPVTLSGYIESLEAGDVKRILSTNQYLIRTGSVFENTAVCQPLFVPNNRGEKTGDCIFRAFGFVRSSHHDLIVESIRKTTGWEEELKNKVLRMEKVLKSKHTNLETPLNNPSVVLIAEDDTHMKECMDLLKYTKLELRFSHDLKVFNDADSCLVYPDKKASALRLLFGFEKVRRAFVG